MSPSVMDLLGQEFASSPTLQKIYIIDTAIGRVLWSQRSETGNNANTRADLADLKELRSYFYEVLTLEQQGEQFLIGVQVIR